MDTMVIYCSRTGSTEKIARQIAKDLGSPLLKAKADVLYGGFFSACVRMVANRLQKSLPKSVTETPDILDCDTLFLGFPIQWDDMPDYYREFLGGLEADGRCLIPFTTSGRSGMNHTTESFRTFFPNAETRNLFHFDVMQRGDYTLWKRELLEDAAIENVIR